MSDSKRRKWMEGITYKKKSRLFLLPMLNTLIYHQSKTISYLIDVCFVQMGFPQIVVIFDNIDYIPLKEDIHRLTMCPYYVGIEYADEDREVCMFFDVPKEFKKDFELFTQGKYSEFSEPYKKLLVKSYGSVRETTISPKTDLPNIGIYDAIYPTDDIKKLMAKQLSTSNFNVDWKLISEVLSPPNIELEEFKQIEELC